MSDTNIEVSLPLDNDGFLSRECQYCKMRFKVNKDDFDGEKFLTKFFVPVAVNQLLKMNSGRQNK